MSGYRIQPKKHKPIVAAAHDVPTPSIITVKNGKISVIAFPCWYYEIRRPERAVVHNRTLKDHLGYPGPNGAFGTGVYDNVSQERDLARHPEPQHIPPEGLSPLMHYQHGHHPSSNLHLHGRPDVCGPLCDQVDQTRLIPIHLKKYGYQVSVVFDEFEGLTMNTYIDQEDDWIIRLKITTNCPAADKQPLFSRFAISGLADDGRRDVISGMLKITPGLVVPERN